MLRTILRTRTAAAFLLGLGLGSAIIAQHGSARAQQPPPKAPPAQPPQTLPGQPPPKAQPIPQPVPPVQPPATLPGQPPQVKPAPGQPAPAATTTTYRAKQVLGSKITIQGNTAIGTVDDIVFDSAGNLEYLVVENNGKMVTVPFEAAKFDLKSQTATLSITPEVYKTIPTYTSTTYPEFYTPTYRTQIYKYYGLTPRELRRIERIGRP